MNLTFKTQSFRRIEGPFDRFGRHCHIAVVEARDLPKELANWRDINPREPNIRSAVARQIRETIVDEPESFFVRNRGLVVMASSVKHDNQKAEVTITLEDKKRNGLLDGGHTLKVLLSCLEEFENLSPIQVRMEVLSGFDKLEEIVEVVESRNTSRQVQDVTLLNVRGHFNMIRKVLAGTPAQNVVSFSEFELYEGDPKPVSIREVLSYLICFDVEGFGEDNHPHRAYHSKAGVMRHYLDNKDRMKQMLPLLPDILKLHDVIYSDLPAVYNEVGGEGGGKGHFAKLTGIRTQKKGTEQLHFSDLTTRYGIPSSYIYPLLAAFRQAVMKKRGGEYAWRQDPFVLWEKTREKLVRRLGAEAREYQNPNRLGKDVTMWEAAYVIVERELTRKAA